MWKDFFYFSKSQRIAIVVLIILIVITIAIELLLPYLIPQQENTDKSFFDEAKRFEQTLVSRDSLRRVQWQQKYDTLFQSKNNYSKKADTYSLFKFDPNSADSATFVKLGLKPFVASNILKFRSKAGKFRTVESFSKVYGITPEKYNELQPYIAIAEIKQPAKDSLKSTTTTKIKNLIVDLNSADTTELMKVYGIGRGYAKSIVRFRQQTGGFVSVEQLRDLYGMSDESYRKISPACRINTDLVRKISVNTASVERLNAHPYLNFYESKAIYEYRRRKGKLKSINELSALPDLKPETIRKIQPYLSFE